MNGLTFDLPELNTLTRPNYSDIIPLLYTYSQSRQVDYRNVFLEPGKSENLDFSVALNENRLGFFSVGYFQKNIEDLIYSSGRRYIDDPEKYGFQRIHISGLFLITEQTTSML